MMLARALILVFVSASFVSAQDSFKVEAAKIASPEALAASIRGAMTAEGARVLDAEGKLFAEIWLRKGIPVSAKPGAGAGAVQFPVLAEGELLGAIKFIAEGHDYRDQAIAPGTYTIRYGLQPVNGDHLGVSSYRDYALLVPAEKDDSLEPLDRKKLQAKSAEAAGSSHPAVMMLLAATSSTKTAPAIIRDEEKNTWSVVLALPPVLKGEPVPSPLLVQLVISGMAM